LAAGDMLVTHARIPHPSLQSIPKLRCLHCFLILPACWWVVRDWNCLAAGDMLVTHARIPHMLVTHARITWLQHFHPEYRMLICYYSAPTLSILC